MYLKPTREGNIQRVLVPAPMQGIIPNDSHITDEHVQYTVEDPKEIFNILLRQNYRSLLKSQESVFTSKEMRDLLGNSQKESEIVEQILNGTFDSNELKESKELYGNTLENFLKSMRRATTSAGNKIDDFRWRYGKEEFQDTLKKHVKIPHAVLLGYI